MDIFLVLAIAILSGFTTAIGFEMANHSPEENTNKRWYYRTAFFVVFVLTVATAFWQATRSASNEAGIKAEALKDRTTLEAQLNSMKGQLVGITQFVEHPPPSLSREQVAAVVRSMLRLDSLATISNSQLRSKAFEMAENLMKLADDSRKKTDELVQFWRDDNPNGHAGRNRLSDFDALSVALQQAFQLKYMQSYVEIFQEIINRLPDKENPSPGRDAWAFLWAGGLFNGRVDPEVLASRLEEFAKKLKP